MCYAMIGIPLGKLSYLHEFYFFELLINDMSYVGLVMFQSIGERVNRLSRWVDFPPIIHTNTTIIN
jgi:hypothetical protein